jgi:hypothetical protein
MCENRTMKPDEIVLRSREGEMRENDGGLNLIKVHFKHMCKCLDNPQCNEYMSTKL